MQIFFLPHKIDTGPPPRHNWLWYSHGLAPTDRPAVSGYQDPNFPGVRLASHYFLDDFAHNMLPSGYILFPVKYGEWKLAIMDNSEAAMFKLTFM